MPALRHRLPDLAQPPAMQPEQERRSVLHGIEAFIERVARARPLMLVFEDLHWANESTVLLLEHLLPRIATIPLVVLETFRDTDLERTPFARALPRLARQPHVVEMQLAQLTEAEVGGLVAALG